MILAVAAFFVMAAVGIFSGLTPATGCWRAFSGAVIFYIAVTIAARSALSIVISSMVESKMNNEIEDNQ
jgi:hypothetical protein